MAEAEKRSYRGNCHCGAFIFEVKAPEIKSAMSCNCSICTKKGYLWFFPREPITVVKGEGSLKEYAFGPKQTIHLVSHIYLGTIDVTSLPRLATFVSDVDRDIFI